MGTTLICLTFLVKVQFHVCVCVLGGVGGGQTMAKYLQRDGAQMLSHPGGGQPEQIESQWGTLMKTNGRRSKRFIISDR